MKIALISSILNLTLVATALAVKGIGKTSEELLPGALMKHLRTAAQVQTMAVSLLFDILLIMDSDFIYNILFIFCIF